MPDFSMCSHDTLTEGEEEQFDYMMSNDALVTDVPYELKMSTYKNSENSSDEDLDMNVKYANPNSPDNPGLHQPIFS